MQSFIAKLELIVFVFQTFLTKLSFLTSFMQWGLQFLTKTALKLFIYKSGQVCLFKLCTQDVQHNMKISQEKISFKHHSPLN